MGLLSVHGVPLTVRKIYNFIINCKIGAGQKVQCMKAVIINNTLLLFHSKWRVFMNNSKVLIKLLNTKLENLMSSSLLSKNLKIKVYRTIILPVILYGCETWSLTLREERRLRVFENMVLRRIFGPKRDEVTGKWRKLHNEELNNLYSSPNILRVIKSRRMRWAWHVARMGEGRGVYRVLVGKPEGRRPLERPRRRWEDNIRMDLREVG